MKNLVVFTGAGISAESGLGTLVIQVDCGKNNKSNRYFRKRNKSFKKCNIVLYV